MFREVFSHILYGNPEFFGAKSHLFAISVHCEACYWSRSNSNNSSSCGFPVTESAYSKLSAARDRFPLVPICGTKKEPYSKQPPVVYPMMSAASNMTLHLFIIMHMHVLCKKQFRFLQEKFLPEIRCKIGDNSYKRRINLLHSGIRLLPHAAILILLPASARAWVISPYFLPFP